MRSIASQARALVVASAVASCAAPAVAPAVVVAPKGSLAEPAARTPDDPFRASPPQPEPGTPFVAPAPREARLPNGLRLLVFERARGPLAGADLVLRGGMGGLAVGESPAALYLGVMAALTGTTTREEKDIYGEMSAQFGTLSASANDDWVNYQMRAPWISFDPMLQLLRDVALHATYPPKKLEIERQRYLDSSPQRSEQPSTLALRALAAAVYGHDHPYARALQPLDAEMATVSGDEVARAWHRAVDPVEATLIVVGEADYETLKARATAVFGDWKHDPKNRPPSPVPPPQVAPPARARLVVVDQPGATYSTIAYGTAISPVLSPNRVAEAAVYELLGGMPSSAVDRTLRDELGATAYGTARMRLHRGVGLSWTEAKVVRDKTGDALLALDRRVRELHEKGPTQQELVSAKGRMGRAEQAGIETTGGLMDFFSAVSACNRPLNELEIWPARVDALSANDVRAAVPAPDAMTAVVVGDLSNLRPILSALHWGAIELRDASGAVVTP